MVVYLSFPTSNHNNLFTRTQPLALYIFRFLHQTTTSRAAVSSVRKLYIFRFLHQTTTVRSVLQSPISCISFVSYIKPQLPTPFRKPCNVVYLSFPTSNHNLLVVIVLRTMLYIFRFLHQTTTYLLRGKAYERCISFVSYIKPQPIVNYCLYINSLCCID